MFLLCNLLHVTPVMLICSLYYNILTGYLLFVWQLVPHARQESCELALGEVWPLLVQFGTFLLREDKHG